MKRYIIEYRFFVNLLYVSSNFMMLPNFPTDNFYKFLTISGLALVVFSFYSIHTNTQNMKAAKVEWNRQTAGILIRAQEYAFKKTEVDYYKASLGIKDYTKRMQVVNQTIGKDTAIDEVLLAVIENKLRYVDTTPILIKQRIINNIKKMDTLAPAVVLDRLDFNQQNDQFQLELRNNSVQVWLPLGVGLLILNTGLILWYRRHQVIQDKLLRKNLTNSSVE